MKPIDQNGNKVTASVRREPDGTWARNVWWGSGVVTNVERRYGYPTKAAALAGDISETAKQTAERIGERRNG